MIPTPKTWTIILSTVSSAWGSFTYDEKEDAVRFTTTPTAAEFEESLEYRFEKPTLGSVDVVLGWDKLQISFPVTVDSKALTVASIKSQLRGLSRFSWQAWNQAAQWTATNDYNLDQGLAWADRSIGMQPTYANLTTKAAILEKKKDAKGAEALAGPGDEIPTEADINNLAYQRLAEKKNDQALALFRERQGPPRLLELLRQPRGGARRHRGQEGRRRELQQGARPGAGPSGQEADQRLSSQTSRSSPGLGPGDALALTLATPGLPTYWTPR